MSRQASYATARRTTVASLATAAQILPARNRFGGVLYNRSTAILYLLWVDPNTAPETVSATVHSVEVAAGGYYNFPEGMSAPLNGVWVAANADCQITEYV